MLGSSINLPRWEGRVIEVCGEVFSAELTPINDSSPSLFADFDISLLNSDAECIEVGTLFYVSVATANDRGMIVHKSCLQLRRIGPWTATDLEEIRTTTERFREDLADSWG